MQKTVITTYNPLQKGTAKLALQARHQGHYACGRPRYLIVPGTILCPLGPTDLFEVEGGIDSPPLFGIEPYFLLPKPPPFC